MVYDLGEFKENDEESIQVDNDTGKFDAVTKNPFMNTVWELVKKALGYQVTRFILMGVFLAIMFLISFDYSKSVDVAGGLSDAGAKDDYFKFFEIFAKESGHKSVKLNMHSFYHTKGVRALESKFHVEFDKKIKFSKIFAYQKYDDQDFIVMKGPARGKNNKRLDLESWTLFGTSADDYCEDYFEGFVPDEEMEAAFVKSWRIRKIKNKEGQKRFRCVIGPDVIQDFIEDDKDD